jgi:hypothetical protein
MKQILSVVALSLCLATPQRSHALIVGAAAGPAPLVIYSCAIAGGITMAGGSLLATFAPGRSGARQVGRLLAFSGLALFAAGILLLDSETQSAQFLSLSDESARSLGLSRSEHAAYESELPEINALFQEVTEGVPADEATSARGIERARQLWEALLPHLSSDTQYAVRKIFAAQRI